MSVNYAVAQAMAVLGSHMTEVQRMDAAEELRAIDADGIDKRFYKQLAQSLERYTLELRQEHFG